MKLESKVTGSVVVLSIYESITSLGESLEVKNAIEKLISTYPEAELHVNVHDALIMPSSVIGTMLKISEINKVNLSLFLAKDELMDNMKKMKLDEILNIKKLY